MKRKKKTKKVETKRQKSVAQQKIERISTILANTLSHKSTNKNVIFFIGNGISGRELSTKSIVSDFVKKSASNRPRDFEKERESVKNLSKTLESNGGIPTDMTIFMSNIRQVDVTKQEFYSYLIESCCRSQPNDNHRFILYLIHHCSNLNSANKRIAVFTTNYDNLFERVFQGPRYLHRWIPTRSLSSGSTQSRKFYYNARFIHRKISRQISFKVKYTMEIINDKRSLSVIPLHGNIRVCRCPTCNRTLTSEIASLGKMRCVYCGEELPPIIVPTSEGEADKQVLKLFEDSISNATALFFIGYGYDDPHILDRIKRGISTNKEQSNLAIINICHKCFPLDKLGLPNLEVCDLSQDITEALVEINEFLGKDQG